MYRYGLKNSNVSFKTIFFIFSGIHNTDNVKTFYTHEPIAIVNGTASFDAPIYSSHFLTHFRVDPTAYLDNNINGSVRKLKIDSDFFNFLIKNSTNFCNNLS